MEAASLYICPWSLRDPLCRSQSLAYLRGLSRRRGYKFALITFENPRYAVAESEIDAVKKNLEAEGIFWYPVEFRPGLSLAAKALDNLAGIVTGLRVYRKHRPLIVHSRSSMPAFLAMVLAKTCGMKFLYDADSMLSEEYVATGHWTRRSKGFRALAKTESLARQTADEAIVLTDTLRGDFINKFNVAAPIKVIPCCVDTKKFRATKQNREKYRNELGLGDEEKLLVYVGKIGERYLVGEIFDFFKIAGETVENLRLLIISKDAKRDFDGIAESKNIEGYRYFVRAAPPEQVAEWLAAADTGIAFIKNSASERGASPIKIAEYLAAGLPVVVSSGIGDVSCLIAEKNIGLTVKDYSPETYREVAAGLKEIWRGGVSASEKCRQAADDYFSLEAVGIPKYIEVYERMLQKSRRS